MSLFSAMTSGVSGLAAQSSAMAAISDNITNVNTVGYKGSDVDFETLVTKQATGTQYSGGGVQARPRSGVDVQGLLQPSSSSTDLGISGSGFFVVNGSNQPSLSDPFVYTRAGSFSKDELGYLRNTSGYYLQGWPTDANGDIVLPKSQVGITNQNIISTDFLETVNLNRLGGTAEQTTRTSIGANLPSDDTVGDSHAVDVQFYDTLGNTNAVEFNFTKSAVSQWDLSVTPPKGTATLTLYDSTTPVPQVYRSAGQLEFSDQPDTTAPASVSINGTSYTFVSGTPASATEVQVGSTLAATVQNLVNTVISNDAEFQTATTGHHSIEIKSDDPTAVIISAGTNALGQVDVDYTNLTASGGTPATSQGLLSTTTFSLPPQAAGMGSAIEFGSDGLPKTINVASMEVDGFVSGAADMNGTDGKQIDLQFGATNKATGMTQFGSEFTPSYIETDGARFGVFTGVTISSDGLMSALFDNGEQRPIYRIPIVTFVNPDGLIGMGGNVWESSEQSGNPTLRTAASGPAGKIEQSSLESSTVDIGQEFTTMIVAQRAYSAATKIISTADDMLDELVHLKR